MLDKEDFKNDLILGILVASSFLLLTFDVLGLVTLEKSYYAVLPTVLFIFARLLYLIVIGIITFIWVSFYSVYKRLYGKK